MLEEIELYFHPEWQRSFTCNLMEIIGQLTFKQIRSINVLYVTHSPYILSDIPKTNVLFLKNGEADYNRTAKYIINEIKLEHIKGITFDYEK